MVSGIALFMPIMVYVNAQYAVSRAGGDTKSLMFVDGMTTILLILVGILLKKERWLKNLTAE